MKFLIFGNGWLGNKFHNFFTESSISTSDITKFDLVEKEIISKKPEVVINCAGKTGRPNIDWCEDHKFETYSSNVTGPFTLASACSKLNIKLVHIGSGCIYQGDNNGKGYSETDEPNFFGSFYSRTKIWSEEALKEFPNVLQVRIRMPIDGIPSDRNLITKITNYKRVISVKNSITALTPDFFNAVRILCERNKTGIYNLTFPGSIEHKEILDLYKEIVDRNFSYELFSLDELHNVTKAKRSNCVLNNDKITREIQLPNVREALKECLYEYSNNFNKVISK